MTAQTPQPPQRFTKRPVTIEAMQYTGNNLREVIDFLGKHERFDEMFPTWSHYEGHVKSRGGIIDVVATDGVMSAQPGAWIIRGINGECYPCKPDIFEATYDRASPSLAAPQTPSDAQIEMDIWPALRLQGHTLTLHECQAAIRAAFVQQAPANQFSEVDATRIAHASGFAGQVWSMGPEELAHLLNTTLTQPMENGAAPLAPATQPRRAAEEAARKRAVTVRVAYDGASGEYLAVDPITAHPTPSSERG